MPRGSRTRSRCGGRYDEVGKAFGRARPATGFSMDLRELACRLAPDGAPRPRPCSRRTRRGTRALSARVEALRAAGMVVIVDLPGHAGRADELELRPQAREAQRQVDRARRL